MRRNLGLFLLTLALTGVLTYAVFLKSGLPLLGIDDANVAFVYAHNFLAHGAFTYQPGGERVEGFTSMLWELACIVAFKFFSAPLIGLLVAEVVLVSLALTYLLAFVRDAISPRGLAWAYGFFLLAWTFSTTTYVMWSTISLMEFALWTSLQIALVTSLLFLTRTSLTPLRQAGLCALFAAFVLTRPESLALGFVYVLLLGLILYFKDGRRVRTALFATLPSFCAYAGSALALTAFQLWYFGFPFANTYYQKVSSDVPYRLAQGAYYFAKFIYWYPAALLTLLAIVVIAFLLLRRYHTRSAWLTEIEARPLLLQLGVLGIVIAANLALPIYEGGDHFAEARLFFPIWPLLALPPLYLATLLKDAFVRGDWRLLDTWFVRGCTLLAAAIVFFYFQPYKWYQRYPYSVFKEIAIAQAGQEQGAFLTTFFGAVSPLPLVGTTAAGGIALTYKGPIADLLGLNDVAMAHQTNNKRIGLQGHAAFDTTTFFSSMPADLLMPIPTDKDADIAQLEASESYTNINFLEDLFDNPTFKDLFMPAIVYNPTTGQYLFAYWRDTFLAQLKAKGFKITAS